MSNCAACQLPVKPNEGVIDHILPGPANSYENTRLMHTRCFKQEQGLWRRIKWEFTLLVAQLVYWIGRLFGGRRNG